MRTLWLLALLAVAPPTQAALLFGHDTEGGMDAAPTPSPFAAGAGASIGASAATATVAVGADETLRAVVLYLEPIEPGWTAVFTLHAFDGLGTGRPFSLATGSADAVIHKERIKGATETQIVIAAGAAVQTTGRPIALEAGTTIPIEVVAPRVGSAWEVVVGVALMRDGIEIHQEIHFEGRP